MSGRMLACRQQGHEALCIQRRVSPVGRGEPHPSVGGPSEGGKHVEAQLFKNGLPNSGANEELLDGDP